MKILNVIENIDEETGGGATERARQLSLHLSKMGHHVTVLTTTCNLSQSSIDSLVHVKLVALPCLNRRFYVPRPLLGRVNELVKESDVIHLISHWTMINVIVFVLASINKKPYVVTPLGALPIYGRSKFLKRIYNLFFGRKIIQNASKSIVTTLNELPAFRSLNVDESRIVHIPNGINEEDYLEKANGDLNTRLGLDNHPFILFIGRLNPIKGPDLLLKAFCKIKDIHSDVHLVYIGPNEGMLSSLEKISENNSVTDRVHFLGYVSREDKSNIIHSSLFLIIPSRQEAMSIVVLESGIAGKPVLLTDQCGFDKVETIGGGLVVSADVEGLSQGMDKMLSQRENLYVMGKVLQKTVRKDYLWSMVAKRYLSIFEELSTTQP